MSSARNGEEKNLYRCYSADGRLLYVGVSWNPAARLVAHRSAFWGYLIDRYDVTTFKTATEARAAERAAIRAERPRFNRQGRWADRSSWTADDYRDYFDATRHAPFSSHRGPRMVATRDECLIRYGTDIADHLEKTA